MKTQIYRTSAEIGEAAAREAAAIVRQAIAREGRARIIAATGTSQLPFLERLCAMPEVDWCRVEMFRLDEYVGLPIAHPASFRKYLLERLIRPTGIQGYHFLDGEGDLAAVCRRVGDALQSGPMHLACVGFGENGHLAFNDPPADFATEEAYIVVNLDEACRRQQVGEGWFKTIEEVPARAITMSVQQVLKSQKILCTVPELRKAKAVNACMEGEISPHAPGSILRTHADGWRDHLALEGLTDGSRVETGFHSDLSDFHVVHPPNAGLPVSSVGGHSPPGSHGTGGQKDHHLAIHGR